MHCTTATRVPVPFHAGLLITMGIFTSHGLSWPSLLQKSIDCSPAVHGHPLRVPWASDGVRTTAQPHGTGTPASSPDMSRKSGEEAGCSAPSFCSTSFYPASLSP